MMEPPTIDEGRWEMVGDSIVALGWALEALFLLCINAALTNSLCAVGVASMITSQLIKMPSIQTKIMWQVKNVKVLLILTQFTWWSMYFVGLSAVAGSLLLGPMNGAFTMIIIFGLLYFLCRIQVPAWGYTRDSLHAEAKLLVLKDAPDQDLQRSTVGGGVSLGIGGFL